MNQVQGGMLGMLDLFSGGALARFAVFSLGIMPYITSSIIMQLLQVVIPKLEQMAKEKDFSEFEIEKTLNGLNNLISRL